VDWPLVKRVLISILDNLTDDLRRPPWKGMKNDLAGHCYVASEAMYHLLGGRFSGCTPMTVRVQGQVHWFLKGPDGEIIDPTSGQFECRIPYEKARGRGFLTRLPSRRAQLLMALVRGPPNRKKH
jgi:hypothetical protein